MKQIEAIGLCRVSTKRQLNEGNLEPQEKRIIEGASYLKVNIVRWWMLAVSSKRGRNLKRKDILEMYEFCKTRRTVKYLIVDEPDRFMRSIDEYYYWKVMFKKIGVQIRFANKIEANPDDKSFHFDELIDIYKAQSSNEERMTKTPEKQFSKMQAGYYPFAPHPGYKRGPTPSLHEVDEERFIPLQTALKSIANHECSVEEAFNILTTGGYRTVNGHRIDMARFKSIAIKPFYAGIIQVSDWPVATKNGLHEHMITEEEHETIKQIIAGKGKRFTVNKKNPRFPLNETLCYECTIEQMRQHKFTGYRNHNGKYRDESKRLYYERYRCRGCKTYFTREEMHSLVSNKLRNIKPATDISELIDSLKKVWRMDTQDNLNKINFLKNKITLLEEEQGKLALSLALTTSEDVKKATESAISNNSEKIRNALDEKLALENSEDLDEFIKFALNYTEHVKEKYWELDWVDRKRCEHLLFPDGFYLTRQKKVYTPKISPIYRYAGKKKEPLKALVYLNGGSDGT